MAVVSSEGGLLSSLTGTRYGNGDANLDSLLDGYTGDEIATVRMTRESVRVKEPCVNINVMCQPCTLQEFTSNKLYNQRGLIGRFLFACAKRDGKEPNEEMKAYLLEHDPEPPPTEIVDAYNDLIRSILSLEPDYDERGKPIPRIIHFSDEAMRIRRAFELEKDELLRELDEDDPMCGWLARMVGHAVRLAGIFHVCEYLDNADAVPISAEEFQKAVTLTRYFKAHAEYAFSMSGTSMSEAERDALYIWKRILKSGQDQIAKRDLNRLCHGRFKQAEYMEPGINELVAHGYIRTVETKTGGHPSVMIEINPEAKKEK